MRTLVLASLFGIALSGDGRAEEFAVTWLENCLEAAQSDPRPRLAAIDCSQRIFDVCEYADSPQSCVDAVVQVMNDETARLISLLPSSFGENEIARNFYAKRYQSVATGEGLPDCAQEGGSYPACESVVAVWKYQFARGLAIQTGIE